MNCLFWNCRGAGNPRTVRDLQALCRAHSPKLVFLCETRQPKHKMARVRNRLGLKGFDGISSQGKSGGLALYWDESLSVNVLDINERWIDAYVRLSDDEPMWRVTFVYGEPRVENRHLMWDSLCRLRSTSDIPWLVAGDFNEAMWEFEHLSSTPRPRNQMVAFRECLEDCQLVDLGFSGHPFTYNNKRSGRANVQVRLDRAVADNLWHDLFPECEVAHLTSPSSDHCPVILRCIKETRVRTGKTRRYEVMWEREPALAEIVAEAWSTAGAKGNLGNICSALRSTLLALHKWSNKKLGNVTKEIEKSRTRLEELTKMNADRNEIRRESDHMNELLYKEEMMWLQRSRVEWLKHGDRNTKFFHRKAVWRAHKNKIKGLVDADGNYQTDHRVMSGMALSYFRTLFEADQTLQPETVVPLFEEVITADVNDKLCAPFSDKEISDALFQIGPLKAPGPDGLPARFFQRHWSILREDIIAAVREFFVTGIMPEGVNSTTIVLIPKVDNPRMMTEFRPISLCNVVYKIIAKCLVNRLRPILGEVVSEEQSAFVPGRLITDNALIAFECTHYIRQEKDPDRSFCAYKLDLSKAYDRVDWRFLEQVMQRMGFANQWVKWIMACVTSVRYCVNLNGTLSDSFAPTRGLRQGDPLSPFLFLFVADGLAAILRQKVQVKEVTPVRVCPRAPGISHLLFADDTLLFFRAMAQEANNVKEALAAYAHATGQLINPSKCSILFGEQCPVHIHEEVKEVLEVQNHSFEERYLGLPTPSGRMTKDKFQNLQQKYTKRMVEWDAEQLLAQSGREVLIKSVALAIPTYIMSVFRLPASTCEDLMRMIRSFYWGVEKGRKKMHWKAWTHLIKPKAHGGLGFRDLRLFNQALLARQAWRLLSNPDSLCERLLKARYYPNGRLEDTVFPAGASTTWQGVQHGLELLKRGLIWRVGNGESIRIWRDSWIPRNGEGKPVTPQGRSRLRRVADLVDNHGSWRPDVIHKVFLPVDAKEILKIKTSTRLGEDIIAWAPEKSGRFSVRSAYRLALEEHLRPSSVAASRAPDGRRAVWSFIWRCPAPPKVRTFVWRLVTDCLPTWVNRKRRGLEVSDLCPLCATEPEDTFHTFCRCSRAVGLWQAMAEHWRIPEVTAFRRTGIEWLAQCLCDLPDLERMELMMTLWRCWHVRNELTHDKQAPPVEASCRFLLGYVESLIGMQNKPEADPVKGKQVVEALHTGTSLHTPARVREPVRWYPPPAG
jgi:hypothetical protein